MENSNKFRKKSNILRIFFFFIFSLAVTYANEVKDNQHISLLCKSNQNPYVEFYSTDITDYYHPENKNKYPSTNLFDGFLNTCWVVGSATKLKIGNTLYIKVPDEIPIDRLILNIFSGYGKNKKLYYANARPKSIRISVYLAYGFEMNNTEVASSYLIKKYPIEKQFDLKDFFGVQSFPLKLDKKDLLSFRNATIKEIVSNHGNDNSKINVGFILKLEITDIYKGNKYNDICISEIFFNNRFVTHYPLQYNRVNKVYIKNDNILLADYFDKKNVLIYKDKLSDFTEVDWEKYSNWAILHYVKSKAVGEDTRIEELYLLIDLKNRKVANNEFEKCTGISIYSPVIEKNNIGRIFIDVFDEYKVELK